MKKEIIVEISCNNKYDEDTLLELLVMSQIEIILEEMKLDKNKSNK